MGTAEADQPDAGVRGRVDKAVSHASNPAKGADAGFAVVEAVILDFYGFSIEPSEFGEGNAMFGEALGSIKGNFILSINDATEIRDIFSAFALHPVETTHTMAAMGNRTMARELLIANDDLPQITTKC